MVITRVLDEQQQVRAPCLPHAHGLHLAHVVTFLIDSADHRVRRGVRREAAQACDRIDRVCRARIARLRSLGGRDVKRRAPVRQADLRQLVGRQAEQRRQQGRGKIDIERRVAEHAQQRDDRRDLTRGQKAAFRLRPDGHAAARERVKIRLRLLCGRAQQNADIGRADAPCHAAVRDKVAALQHRRDLLGDLPRLKLRAVKLPGILRRIDQAQRTARLDSLRKGRARRKRLLLIIVHLADFTAHEL